MLTPGPAQRVTVFVNEDHRYHGRAAHMAVLEFLFYQRIAGATLLRAAAGFGVDHHLHSSEMLAASGKLPVQIEFVESPEKVSALLPKIRDMIGRGVVTVSPTEVVLAPTPEDKPLPAPAHHGLHGPGKLMRIYISEKDRWRDRPLHQALLESLRAHDIAGVTVYRGIAGYGASGRLHKDGPLTHDVPMMLSVVDTAEHIRNYLPLLDEMLVRGLVAVSDVEVIKYTHDGAAAPGQPGAPA